MGARECVTRDAVAGLGRYMGGEHRGAVGWWWAATVVAGKRRGSRKEKHGDEKGSETNDETRLLEQKEFH